MRTAPTTVAASSSRLSATASSPGAKGTTHDSARAMETGAPTRRAASSPRPASAPPPAATRTRVTGTLCPSVPKTCTALRPRRERSPQLLSISTRTTRVGPVGAWQENAEASGATSADVAAWCGFRSGWTSRPCAASVAARAATAFAATADASPSEAMSGPSLATPSSRRRCARGVLLVRGVGLTEPPKASREWGRGAGWSGLGPAECARAPRAARAGGDGLDAPVPAPRARSVRPPLRAALVA
mmetsp:Transcript_17194/g.53192  ORF Transcript_17194/g.53192 Transcript_17194/m.53192 type:complete len:244 (-) Transcript_17194:251-982(-)